MVEVMAELNEVMAIPVTLKDKTIWVRTDIPPNAKQLFRAMGMAIPPKTLGIPLKM